MGIHSAAQERSDARRSGRIWAAVFAAVTVTAVTAGLAPAAVASPTVATSASVTLSASTIAPGGTATVTGGLRAGSKGLPGVAVVLQERIAGTGTWRTLRSGRTDASGNLVAATGALVLSRDYRLHFAGTSRYVAVNGASRRLTVLQWLTVLSKPGATPLVGSALVFAGKAGAGLTGDLLHLQLAEGTAWTTVATSQVNADATWAVRGRASVAGIQQYRVLVDGKPGATGVATFPTMLTVSAWYWLHDLDVVESSGRSYGDSATVAGKTYYHPVSLSPYYGTAHVTYNLSYRCSRFEGTVGNDDTSSTTAASHDVVVLDGVETATADIVPGHSYRFDTDVTGGFRLTLSSAIANARADVGWGDARILCAGKP